MSSGNRLRFGAFIAPFHPMDENPTLALERDLELVSWLDRLGYEEAWIGEHHSAGFEIIASPELFIATAAERTRNIKLGTGVSSLPYHQPLMLAERIIQLDHFTRGRVMFGVGPGALPSDAHMMGIDITKQRDMMDEALDVLIPLLRGETVTADSSWFRLNEARVHLLPYSHSAIEVAVASQVSPTGALAAGRHGISLLSLGATSTGGFNALASNWAIAEEKARDSGTLMNRDGWRLVGPMHIAETREKARENLRFGFEKWCTYFTEVAALPLVPPGQGNALDTLIDMGFAIVGTPEDAIAQIERLQQQSGGFGCFLQLGHNWADFEATKKSYELFARYVFPKYRRCNANRDTSVRWVMEHRADLLAKTVKSKNERISRLVEEKGAQNLSPSALAAAKISRPPER